MSKEQAVSADRLVGPDRQVGVCLDRRLFSGEKPGDAVFPPAMSAWFASTTILLGSWKRIKRSTESNFRL